MKEKNAMIGKTFYLWRNQLFRHGFHYKYFKMNKLDHENVRPSLEEVQRFQLNMQSKAAEGGLVFDAGSDLDEWDILDDKTLTKTI
jgi:transcription elongation factor